MVPFVIDVGLNNNDRTKHDTFINFN